MYYQQIVVNIKYLQSSPNIFPKTDEKRIRVIGLQQIYLSSSLNELKAELIMRHRKNLKEESPKMLKNCCDCCMREEKLSEFENHYHFIQRGALNLLKRDRET